MSKSTNDLLRELESAGVLDSPGAAPVAPAARTVPASKPVHRESSPLLFVILAAVLVALIGSLPFGSLALYPFSLFTTLIHETGHAVAAVASGGTVASLRVSPDLSGLTETSGGIEAVIAPAGYLGATLAGVLLLLTPLRHARWTMLALAAVPLAAIAFFHPASLFTTVWCAGFALALGAAAWKLRGPALAFLQIFIGVEAGLNALRDLVTQIVITGSASHMQVDASNMSDALFFPPMVWAVLWTVLSVLLLTGTLARIARSELRRRRA